MTAAGVPSATELPMSLSSPAGRRGGSEVSGSTTTLAHARGPPGVSPSKGFRARRLFHRPAGGPVAAAEEQRQHRHDHREAGQHPQHTGQESGPPSPPAVGVGVGSSVNDRAITSGARRTR